jgi:hypothetical protein
MGDWWSQRRHKSTSLGTVHTRTYITQNHNSNHKQSLFRHKHSLFERGIDCINYWPFWHFLWLSYDLRKGNITDGLVSVGYFSLSEFRQFVIFSSSLWNNLKQSFFNYNKRFSLFLMYRLNGSAYTTNIWYDPGVLRTRGNVNGRFSQQLYSSLILEFSLSFTLSCFISKSNPILSISFFFEEYFPMNVPQYLVHPFLTSRQISSLSQRVLVEVHVLCLSRNFKSIVEQLLSLTEVFLESMYDPLLLDIIPKIILSFKWSLMRVSFVVTDG